MLHLILALCHLLSSTQNTKHIYHNNLQHCIIDFYLLQVRDELAQLLEDDDDMADLYLSRKASIATSYFNENDVEELEQLLEVITFFYLEKFRMDLP